MAIVLLQLMIFTLSLAADDMSIISYDESHPDKSMPGGWRTDNEVMALYEEWLVKHGKAHNYCFGEKERRFKIFKDNLRFIDEHNANQSHSYKVGLNRFADLTVEEYRATYLGGKPNMKVSKRSDRYEPRLGDKLPNSVDWRKSGAVAPIKDQGTCGSCWTFSTISAIESINKIVTGHLVTLSEQELVDCDKTGNNSGCDGGNMENAFEFVIHNGGIDTERDYPYMDREGICDLVKEKTRVVSIDDYEQVPFSNESALEKAVAHQPLSIYIDAGGQAIMLYDSGIFEGDCGTHLDHAVIIVGYGTEHGKDYWIVRNSWGETWGEAGYMKMPRNLGNSVNGKCGIAMYPSYPIKNTSIRGRKDIA